jgi:hypothetical protein
MSNGTQQRVGLVVLTGDEGDRQSLKSWLKREVASLHYKVKVLEFGNPEATILLFKSKFGESIVNDSTFKDLHWLCGERTLGDPEKYQSPYNNGMTREVFLSMLTKVWTPVNDSELAIAMHILHLEKEASAM